VSHKNPLLAAFLFYEEEPLAEGQKGGGPSPRILAEAIACEAIASRTFERPAREGVYGSPKIV
jgi:hypothetical protein